MRSAMPAPVLPPAATAPPPTAGLARLAPARLSPAVLAWGLGVLFAALYCCVSLNRYRRLESQAYDLGIFEQAVRAYAHGRAPIVPLKGPGYHLLGDHFHPVLAVLAPVYRVFPDARTLLVAQAVLMALAVVPLARWACETGGRRRGVLVGCLAGASWGVAAAVGDDFHEIAFAVPLLAFAAVALGRRRPVAAVCWALPLVLVKEDLGLTVAAVAVLAFRRAPLGSRARVATVGVALFGVAATVVTVFLIVPAFNPTGGFDYGSQLSAGQAASAPWTVPLRLLWPPLKWLLLALMAATVGFAGLRSPLVLICAPTLAWRLLADNPHYWGVSYHYSAVLMPPLLAGLVEAVGRAGRRRARRTLALAALTAVLTLPFYPLRDVALPSAWGTSERVVQIRAALARIPDGASVVATNHLAAQLAGRTEVALVCREPEPPLGALRPDGAPEGGPQWVAVDLADPSVHVPCPAAETWRMLVRYEQDLGYRVVVDDGDLVLLRHP
ncbi:DUF2079 domain-containing protein [Kitasatospora sp. NPDC092948]|uniref:DUF2079 domain-containing protein n=1 Tax=Kitasatospora sp. NPDC092948 TaxID=3364088 RepID=UPI0038090C27